MKKAVYICHPVSGDIKNNLKKIRDIILYIAENYEDVVPFCPYYAYIESLDDSNLKHRLKGMKFNVQLIQKCCDELWIFGDRISQGMEYEIYCSYQWGVEIVNMSGKIQNTEIVSKVDNIELWAIRQKTFIKSV